jgi:hypothetical protein
MTWRTVFIGAVLAGVAGGGTWVQASGLASAITVEPRIVEARLGRVSLDQLDVSLRVALRVSHAATIRSIAFNDAFVGQVPVWIEPVGGRWPLRSGEELVLPEALLVRVRARDAVGADDFGAIVRRGSVRVRTSVEVAIATPWLARLFFQPATRTIVRQVQMDLPIPVGSGALGPLARIGADIADVAQRGAASWLASGLNRLPGRTGVVSRFGGAVAGVTTRYAIEAGGTSSARERRAAGVWWSPGVFCTTREALEPWRFDVADATTLQQGGGRLRRDRGGVRIEATGSQPAVDLDLDALGARLPASDERRLFTLVEGRPRRLRLGSRESASNLVCLRLDAAAAAPSLPAGAAETGAAAAGAAAAGVPAPPGAEVAAFAPGTAVGLVWTRIAPAGGGRLRLETPLHRASFGSPIVAGDRVIGLVASPTTAWPAAVVGAAAADPHPVAAAAARGARR